MTDQASGLKSDVDNVRAVETFLEAVQDGDFDTAAA
jgi:limonene-1,2-epoxide hydrolase